MPKPKRILQATALATTTPPDLLTPAQTLARIVKAAGNNLYNVEYPFSTGRSANLVELPARFRNAIWLKRGSYVVIDTEAFAGRENKLGGEIVNVVREEREWRKMPYWPKDFEKKPEIYGNGDEDDEEEEEESRMGMMPPSDTEEDEGR